MNTDPLRMLPGYKYNPTHLNVHGSGYYWLDNNGEIYFCKYYNAKDTRAIAKIHIKIKDKKDTP